MRFDTESTICAIATGSEGALRGAIRITGPDSVAIVSKLCDRKQMDKWDSRGAVRFQSVIPLPRLGLIDVEVYLWPDQRSYTGQLSVELHCLGNTILLQELQSLLVANGAVLAQAGEFTLRAFLAGRLDLTQCEAVLGVIHAANNRTLNVALTQLAGGLSQPLRNLRTSLVNLLADIEAGLDFVDEDITFISRAAILDRLDDAANTVTNMLKQMESRASQTVQLQVAIVGAPNAGKSSLINALANQQVSIVSPEAGTTRDYVRVRLDFQGVQLDILDTAGLEESSGATPRALAQQFTQEQISNADLVLYCLAVDDDYSAEWTCPPSGHADEPSVWLLRTKCDLATSTRTVRNQYESEFLLSTQHPESIEQLVEQLRDWGLLKLGNVNQVVPITAARCQSSLTGAITSIANARDAASRELGDEVVASEIRLALDDIGMVAGTVYTDDILDALFSRFCIGK